ncbi:MAG: sigma-70 family RNA polymerase sigma factor [Chloroflexota bacterium]
MVGRAEDEEQTLIRRALRGDLDAFNALILRYQDSAYTLAFRIMGDSYSAADAVQEAFIIAYRRLSSYRGGSFRAWLLRITTNQCYDELRRIRRRPAVSVEAMGEESGDDPAIPDAADTPEEAVEQLELQRAIQGCIGALNPDQRVVLVLCDIEGLDYLAIAEQLGAQIGTVKSRLSRARASVRDCLQGVRELLPAAYRLISDEDDD